MKKFAMLTNNGFRFELHSHVWAETAQKARKEFLEINKGDWFADAKSIKARDVTPQEDLLKAHLAKELGPCGK